MADDHLATEWPLEGHFVVGGSGLYVTTECLGRRFTSRTASHALTIGLPQVDRRPDPIPPELRQRLGEPAIPNMNVLPPAWAHGPNSEDERIEEEHISPVWGGIFDDGRAKVVFPESARNSAVVYRCRFYTTLTVADGEEFEAAAEGFLSELDDWWTRFTSWVGILTSQDFVGLGGHPGGMTQSYPILRWTSNASGQRAGTRWQQKFPPNQGAPIFNLRLSDLEACVTATGNQNPPPEWMLIRDARSLLRAGQARRAILDAGTAAELAMTTLIDAYLVTTNTDEPVRKAVARGYNNLGAKKELLKMLRPGLLSTSVQPDLIDKRNTASHGDGQVTLAQAETAVEIATGIVELAHPLAGLMPSSR
ncbi:MAG: hypothetical protein K2X56_12865 [Mycobacterium pseudokansasii]|uniref:hypothetical protein n=1 Tax=Mycobacterium pseudokansasii TaxID=2341080 RepID=UPI0023EFEE1B|nr:hypothetical protein [Mycobacterium pseudokansasii]MBY0388963.1 hypothetical protein [Mycobacterium pseudokansasii]